MRATEVLDQLRRPGPTRADVARALGISSGSAAEVTARLRAMELLDEERAPVRGRGRPTTVLTAHARGPLVAALDLRQGDWRCAVAGLDALPRLVAEGRHTHRDPGAVLAAVAGAVRAARDGHPGRIGLVSVAVAGTVADGRLAQSASLGWGPVDLDVVAAGLPCLIGNDATLAGVAEVRSGAAAEAHTALHLTVEVGIGGALVVDGRPLTGAAGAAGEFGHVPFGDPALTCPCGARGCWDLEVDGRALARSRGEQPPGDPRGYLQRALDAGTDVTVPAAALGRGVAALVNAHDPDVVTLGGLAAPLGADPAFGRAFEAGLMAFRRSCPPAVLDAAHGADGALHGAVAVGLDHVTAPPALAAWEAARAR